MLTTFTLKDILSNEHNILLETAIELINYKILNEDTEEDDAIIETLDYLQTTVELYDINPSFEHSSGLLELLKRNAK